MTEVAQEYVDSTLPKFVGQNVITPDMVHTFYSETAHLYDKVFAPEEGRYHGPAQCADVIRKHIGSNPDIKILDVASGTGLVAQELRDRGYGNVDGIDANEDMIRQAREKGFYQNLICGYLGGEGDSVPEGIYDVVCVCGGFMPGHIPAEALESMAKKVRKGGLVVNTMREAYLEHPFYNESYWPTVKGLEARGVVQTVEIVRTEKYFEKFIGLVCVFRVL